MNIEEHLAAKAIFPTGVFGNNNLFYACQADANAGPCLLHVKKKKPLFANTVSFIL